MVNPKQVKTFCTLTVVDSIGRNRPSLNLPAISKTDAAPHKLAGCQNVDNVKDPRQQAVRRLGAVLSDVPIRLNPAVLSSRR